MIQLFVHHVFIFSFSVLKSLVHKKRAFHDTNSNGINPDWANELRISGLIGADFNNEDSYARHSPM